MYRGFSLVELSIVLVILGLLTGGILAGQSLIRAAELRRLQNDFSRYTGAVHTFRDKYFALPGDMANASAFWGLLASGAACNTTPATGPATCNGNGNGQVGNPDGNGNEVFRFWQHLANAGLVEGFYSGEGTFDIIVGGTVPDARMSQAAWCARWDNDQAGAAVFSKYPAQHSFLVGRADPSDPCQQRFLKVEEVWNIDMKMDDGNPVNGMVRAAGISTCTDSALPDYTDATYDLDDKSSDRCQIQFLKPF